MMQYSQFAQLAERIVETSRLRYTETGSIPLTLFIVTAKDQLKIVEFPDEVVSPVPEAIRDTVQRYKGTAVVVVAEAWMAEYKAAVEESLEEFLAHHGSPRAHPDRQDVLIIEAFHAERSWAWLMRISREGGRIVCGRAEPFEEGGTVFGRDLSDLLHP